MPSARTLILAAAALLLAVFTPVLVLAGRDQAAGNDPIVVNSTDDVADAALGDGVCGTPTGSCTLRAAVQQANANAGPDVINVPAGAYAIAIEGAGEDNAVTGDLDITDDLTINGADRNSIVIDGGSIDRIFDIIGSAHATISSLTLTGGRPDPADGGAVRNAGTLTLTDMIIDNNHADEGGGIVNIGTLTVQNSVILHNAASHTGGGIQNGGTMTVSGSTIFDNVAPFGGGGVNNLNAATINTSAITYNGSSGGNGGGLANSGNITITNVTFSGNTTHQHGGAISNTSALALVNDTITNNTADSEGSGVYENEGAASFRNVIAALNTGDDCAGPGGYNSQGHNLSSSSSCLFVVGGDIEEVNPMLGPLANNGGLTQTHALLPDSPALDHGDNIGCPPTDQRGVIRPQNGHCDIGAYEEGNIPTPTPTPSVTPTATLTPAASDTPVPTGTPIPTTPLANSPTPTHTVPPASTVTPTRTPVPTPGGLIGDSNCDGRVNSIDAVFVLQYAAGLLGSFACQSAADANQDGRINSIDAALILQLSAGLLSHLP